MTFKIRAGARREKVAFTATIPRVRYPRRTMMIHEGYCFDFPGRSYAFRHADLDGWFVAATGALRAIARVVEPTVVEAIDETHAIFHLVAGDAAAGAYIRSSTRTVSVERDYMTATGAARPAAWPASSAPVADDAVTGISADEAAAFAAHHGWALPTEAEWQLAASTSEVDLVLDGACEYTSDSFEPYPGADTDAFEAVAPGARGQVCGRGKAPRLPPCVAARRGVSRDARPKFVRFRCIRRL